MIYRKDSKNPHHVGDNFTEVEIPSRGRLYYKSIFVFFEES